MKIIQDRELKRIVMMIKGDQDMRNLAVAILSKRKASRWNFTTILLFHAILFLLSLILVIKLHYTFHLGLYMIPVVTACVFQAFWSVAYLGSIWRFRKEYNKHMEDVANNLN